MYWVFVPERSARIIGEHESHQEDKDGEIVMPAVLTGRAMLTGYAIECAFKCLWVKTGHRMVEKGKFVGMRGTGADHNLVQLAKAVELVPNAREGERLRRCCITRFRAEVQQCQPCPPRDRHCTNGTIDKTWGTD